MLIGKKPDTSPKKQGMILVLKEEGISNRQIALRLSLHHKTVATILNKHRETGKCSFRSNCGRKKKLTDRNVRTLKRMAKSNRTIASRKLATKFSQAININVSVNTVRRSLKAVGVRKKKPKKKPRLSAGHLEQRKAFCRNYGD